ncbi:MAG: D-alanyl-D-alanine carboxypeptidase [Novosphingobium sp.]|nr:D-alanyl-D-alanine carboxypeptidase [Novosphingobium sp.]
MKLRPVLIAPLLVAGLSAQAQAPAVPAATLQTEPRFAPEASLTAPIAYMGDLGSGRVLFGREADRRFMPASLTKIMTAYVAFEMLEAGRLHPAQRFAISDSAFAQWRRVGSTMFLARGQAVTVDELLHAIMTISANDGSIVLAEGASGSVPAFVARMNATAQRLGMRDSHFGSPNGWPDQGATYTTARDLAVLTQAMLLRFPDRYRRYVGHREMTFNGIRQENRVPLLGRVAGADGVKTGFTNESGFGLVGSAARDGRRIVMVVAGYDRAWQRARESREFLEWGFAAWAARPLFGRGEVVAEARVQGGADRHVPLIAPLAYSLTTAVDETLEDAALTLRYEGPLEAPVAKGDQVGVLRVAVPGQPPRDLPLVAARSVASAGPAARLRNGLFGLVGL